MSGLVMALDQGTTSSRAIVFDKRGGVVSSAQKEFPQFYPRPGWVEHDPTDIWATQISVAGEALARAGADARRIAAIGITNQRETTIVWDRRTGKPIYNAVVWQCRRTRDECQALQDAGYEPLIRDKTGLVLDSYFSATKIRWILDHVDGAQRLAESGHLLFGTVDSWLLWNLTGGRVHATDVSNASRTMLFNIHTLAWDQELLDLFKVPVSMLPEVRDTSSVFGTATDHGHGLSGLPVGSLVGDQQGALFGQRCLEAGQAKNTYGTGCFLLMNVGDRPVASENGLLSTVAWGLDGRTTYALEGSIFIAGAVVQWLRDELGLIRSATETQALAQSVSDNGGVYLVPAFTGLGAPHWDMDARGTMVGLTRGSSKAHIVRAALESICYQTRDVLDGMTADSGVSRKALQVDGGAVENDFLMQFQSDLLQVPVLRPKVAETTALGAALLAGLSCDVFDRADVIDAGASVERVFEPGMDAKTIERLYEDWCRAVERAKHWHRS